MFGKEVREDSGGEGKKMGRKASFPGKNLMILVIYDDYIRRNVRVFCLSTIAVQGTGRCQKFKN